MGVDYYESVLGRLGASTTGFFRLFMVPGMFHCGGGVGTSLFDMPAAWRLGGEGVRSRSHPGVPVHRRQNGPHPAALSYPHVAKYRGAGSIDEIIDRGIAASLEDFKRGRSYGPFDTAEEMIASLHAARDQTTPEIA